MKFIIVTENLSTQSRDQEMKQVLNSELFNVIVEGKMMFLNLN